MAIRSGLPLEPDRLLGILDSIKDGVYLVDEQYTMEYANTSVIHEFGPISAKKCFAYLHDRTEPCPWCKMGDVRQGKTIRWEWECSRSGKIYDCIDMPLVKPDGSLSKLKIIRDITASKQAHQKLQDMALFPSENPFPVLRIAGDCVIQYSNEPGRVLLEYWGATVGQEVPLRWQNVVRRALETGQMMNHKIKLQHRIFSFIFVPISTARYVNIYGRDITRQIETERALRVSEQNIRKKLDHILEPEGDIGKLELADIIDTASLQAMMIDFYALTHIPMAIMDMADKLLVGVGWQDICTQFHRIHPQTCAYCLESDLELSAVIDEGEFRLYKCKNNMWDAAAPILIGGQKMGSLFIGQFFFEDESPDYEQFRFQAKKYGFNEADYLAALEKVPRLSRESLRKGMNFLYGLSKIIAKTSYANIKLARLMEERNRTEEALRQSNEELKCFNRMTVGRELRMIELKQEVNELCRQAGLLPRYALTVEDGLPMAGDVGPQQAGGLEERP